MPRNVVDSSTHLNSDLGEGGCWKMKSGLEKKLIIFSTFLALAAIGLIVAVVVVSQKSEEATSLTTEKPVETCSDLECMEAAAYLLRTMNRQADPCEDFHEFVCGAWVDNNPIPADKGRFGVFDGLRDKMAEDCIGALEASNTQNETSSAVKNARAFYKTCLKTETMDQALGLDALRKALTGVGVSTDLNSAISGFEVYKTLSNIYRSYGLNFIISFGVGANVNNTENNIISLDQPSSFGLGRNFLVQFDKENERIKAYKKYMQDALKAVSKAQVDDAKVEEILKFEVQVANLTMDPVDRRNASVWYHPMPIGDIEGNIDFQKYVNGILEDTWFTVSEKEVVIAKAEDYFKEISTFIDKTSKTIVSNYLAWRLVQSLGPAMSRELRESQFEFDKVNLGIHKEKKNDIRCFDLTNSYFGHAVGRLYVQKINFKNETKIEVENMVDNLYVAFRSLVDDNNWMDNATKVKSKEKLEKMAKMMAYPEWTLIDKKLDDYYNMTTLNETDFFSNYLKAMKFSVDFSLRKLKQKNNRREDWISAASIVNAFYSPTFNSITFPVGILQNPFYSERLKVLNYGGIGYVIGHEITHGFDDSGRQYDGDGSLNNWWTSETLEKYVERKDCFVRQYSEILDPLSGKQLNGEKTIGENIADNGGIRESYKAYIESGQQETRLPGLEEFSDLQLFYISAGSIWCSQFTKEEMINQINQGVHSPGMYRAYVPLANDEGFAAAFKCKSGSKMNPAKRCTIW